MARESKKSRKKAPRRKKAAGGSGRSKLARKVKNVKKAKRVRAEAGKRRVRAGKPVKAGTVRRKKRVVDPRLARVMKQYDGAVKLFQRKAFRKARELFQKVEAGVSRELAERARVHTAMCDQRLEGEPQTRFRSLEEHYDYAVARINAGELEDARAHLKRAMKMNPEADHVYYALATVSALSGAPDEALEFLDVAIGLRPENRFQARNDYDFESLQDDLGFQQLVFPERFPSAPGRS